MSERAVTLYVFGDGKTDIGPLTTAPSDVTKGVVVILLHALCGRPASLRVLRQPYPHMQNLKKRAGHLNHARRVMFAKQQAISANAEGAVFVSDTEGDLGLLAQFQEGRDAEPRDYPMAVGVAHPCIEAWLLCDSAAIRKGMNVESVSSLPLPETLPAPAANRTCNPKTELARICGATTGPQKDAIARNIWALDRLKTACPASFSPFADEVEQRIRPLFGTPAGAVAEPEA